MAFDKDFTTKIIEKLDAKKVIKLFAEGKSASQIAEELNMSKTWVEDVIREYGEEKRLKMEDYKDIKIEMDPLNSDIL